MAVSIVPKFNEAQIKRILADRVALIEQAILLRLQQVGEKFIINARNNGTYRDVTGNLRSSIGYLVLNKGRQVNSAFPGKTAAGRAKAQQIANEAAAKYGNNIILIVVAGMDYAAAVEARGRDVLTASSIQAKADLQTAIAEISKKLSKK